MRTVPSKFAAAWTGLVGKVPAKRVDMAIALVVTFLALSVYAMVVFGGGSRALFSFIDNIELRSLDARFKARGRRPVDDRIVIVGLDEKTLNKVGSYPIARNYYAQAVDHIAAGRATVIGFDFDFASPEKNSAVEALQELETELGGSASPTVINKIREIQRTSDNDVILADAIKRAGNVVLGHIFLGEERAKAIDSKVAQDYVYVLSDSPFPQIRPEKGGSAFDIGKAWNDPIHGHDGPVMYGVEPNIGLLAEAARSFGFFNYIPDRDGIYRRAHALIRYRQDDCANAPIGECQWYPSLPLEMLKVSEDIKAETISANIAQTGLTTIEMGPYTFPTQPDGAFLINFAGPFKTYPHYSMVDVIDGTVPPSTFRGKIVLMGPTAIGIGDLRPIAFQSSDYMGVELHANVLDNMLHNGEPGRGFLRRGFSQEMADLFFILVFGLPMGYLFARLKPLHSTFSALAAVLAFWGITYFAFSYWGMWLSVVLPTAALVVNYGAITSFRMVFEEREKRKVRKTFERYVSPGVIRLIEQNPKKYFKAGGESKELSIMFSDIRSFTTISESLTPDELVALLNQYLGEMTDIIFQHWGTLDKYIGDAIMAFWGSPFPQPDHATRACAAALDMSARLEELNLRWEVEGRKTLAIGIGVNSGRVSVGNMGSGKRFQWTVMGDAVNLASRLEGQNKAYHTTRIISEFTYAQVKGNFVCRDLDRIRVKGKLKPVGIYELLGHAKDADKHADLLAHWRDAQAAYYRMAWDEAIQKFEALLARYPHDGPAEAFLTRSHEFYREAPAPDWDGVYIARTK